METPVFENLRLELRRGSLVLAVLAALRTEQYGYTLRKALSEQGLEVDEGTLYPLLRRLETQRLLESEWREEEKRTKRFYRLSEEGAEVLAQLFDEWRQIDAALNSVLSEHDDGIGRTISAGGQVLSHRKGSGRHPARVGGKSRV